MTSETHVPIAEELGLQAALLEQAEKRGFARASDRRAFMLRLAHNLEMLNIRIRSQYGDAS